MHVFFTDLGHCHLVVAAQDRAQAARLFNCGLDEVGLTAAGGPWDGGKRLAIASPGVVFVREKNAPDAPWTRYAKTTVCAE
jgi:hypothetical protein